MRLFSCLLKQIAPGKIDIGKNRIYPRITRADLKIAREDIARTERNILLLRHPYLSIKESFGHEEALHDSQKLEFKKKLLEEQEAFAKKRPDVTLDERYMTVSHSDSWDP